MKKFMKGCAMIVLILVVLGFLLTYAAGEVSLKEGISGMIGSITDRLENSSVKYDINDATMFDNSFDILKGDIEKYCPGENISKLDIEVGGCSFVTKVSGDDKFYLEVEKAHKFQGYVKGDTLYIKATVGTATWNDLGDCEIILYLPEGFTFAELDIELGAGIVEFSNLLAQAADLEVGAGQIRVNGAKAEQLTLSVGAGQIELSDMDAAELDVEVGMGECRAQGIISKKAGIECSMGNVELTITGSESDFNYRIDGAMGNVNLGEKSFSGLTQTQTIANGADKDIDLECAMGNITVKFVE